MQCSCVNIYSPVLYIVYITLFDLKNNCLNRLEYSGLYISFTEDSDCKVLYPYTGYEILARGSEGCRRRGW